MDIIYKELSPSDMHKDMLLNFNRYQIVTKEWTPISQGAYILRDQPHIEDWDVKYKEGKVTNLLGLMQRGGKVFGAFDQNRLIGFSAIEGVLCGQEKQYIELTQLHVSKEYRGMHIGTRLFGLCANGARALDAKKLYIVASAAKESQQAYEKLGCVYTTEFIPDLCKERSSEVYLEYVLTK